MHPPTANGNSRLSFWRRVREYAVPPSMIETATARWHVGDWAGACAAAGVDVDLDLRLLTRTHGRELTAQVRDDLRHLAPDLLRWHMPRVAPDGLLRPGLTVALARYRHQDPVYLVVRTPPAWAEGGQRISLALWDGDRLRAGAARHPRARPSPRFRLDLHRHLWDARRSGELPFRAGAGPRAGQGDPPVPLAPGHHCAVDRWADETRIVLRDAGRTSGAVTVRVGVRQRLRLDLTEDDQGSAAPALRIGRAPTDGSATALPVLPEAAAYVLPDLELLRAGAIEPGRLHPLVASALVPGHAPAGPPRTPAPAPAGRPQVVECRGAQHRIGLVDGVLAPLDHDPDELRREELLVALTGTPLPCLRAVDRAHRRPDCLTDVRERLDHGDTAGALAVVEGLLGPGAHLRDGPLRDALEAAARRRILHGLYRSGMSEPAPRFGLPDPARPGYHRSHPRHATYD
ncbi:hypothetical protein ACH5A7_16805 [Streptomyces sp. NPDC018955]|uniref:hypothetical protein n=1 Tax=Streptomyces sp. NPDC018955 TaxID=3365055 RepID=UPI0037881E47